MGLDCEQCGDLKLRSVAVKSGDITDYLDGNGH